MVQLLMPPSKLRSLLQSRETWTEFTRTYGLVPYRIGPSGRLWRPGPAGGIIAQVSVAAATAIVGYDLLRDSIYKRSGLPRILRGAALTGSAAGGDTLVALYIDVVKVALLYNVTTGFPTKDHFFPLGDLPVPPGSDVSAIVEDAPATNPINLLLDIE